MKKLFYTVVVFFGLIAIFYFSLLVLIDKETYPPTALNFTPTEFTVVNEQEVFYSIGNSIKFGNQFSIADKTIFESDKRIVDVHVSPNNSFAVIEYSDEIWLLSYDGSIKQFISKVMNPFDVKSEPVGETFYTGNIQWGPTSDYFYVLEYEVYKRNKDGYISSETKALVKYTIDNQEFSKVVNPMPFFLYAQGENGIYFVSPTPDGDLVLNHSPLNSTQRKVVGLEELKKINNLRTIFYNFSVHDYSDMLIAEGRVKSQISEDRTNMSFYIDDNKVLTTKEGMGFKGPTFGMQAGIGNVFTPSGRYFLLNLYSEQYNGPLLFNVETYEYMKMPADLRIYQNVNTKTSNSWILTNSGVEIRK
ncbi:hypothetical protein QWY77_11765 [Thalassotalea ponticola]|uniref:hypothetical protein n=1 Tax=Thalassotalea ponticola TaxID=1523392 RepID=UPI0025B3D821|nr:hypothetical protein [Thalassotalea ponticola]MDN3653419.1 hypothetical protein [Thalassotalea ponticola]